MQAPTNRRLIECKWIFKIKRNADGSIARYKARLVANGFNQTAIFDFSETFSPVVKPATVQTVITLALANSWKIHQLDVNNVFLNDVLEEHVFMSQPPGFEVNNNKKQLVCKLHKALYGLKQAPRAWFVKLMRITLQSLGFTSSRADNSLFIRFTPHYCLLVLVYVAT